MLKFKPHTLASHRKQRFTPAIIVVTMGLPISVALWSAAAQGSTAGCTTPAGSPWNLCGYDPLYSYTRVQQDFCGASPTYADVQAFKAQSATEQMATIQATAKACMASNVWRGKNGIMWEMADAKVSATPATKAGEDAGEIPLSDYYDDYNLFIYHQLDGVDVRGVLTADYYIQRTDATPTTYTQITNVPLTTNSPGVLAVTAAVYGDYQQFVPQPQRAGVLTTAWTANGLTMFASIPRSTAAHYYQQYLGFDIAQGQGLIDPGSDFVLQEYDNKGTTQAGCAACHRILDPLAYPFTQYNGLSFNIAGINIDNAGGFVGLAIGGDLNLGALSGALAVGRDVPGSLYIAEYNANRMAAMAQLNASSEPNVGSTPAAGVIMGQKVSNLVEWASVAANSKPFANTVVTDYWKLLVGTTPTASGPSAQITDLATRLMTQYKYSVEAMVLDLIQRDAYGQP